MKKFSLLTQQDIKNFILEEISKIDTRETGCFILSEIARKLNTTRDRLNWFSKKFKWVPEYVKGKHKYYNIEKILKSLDENNIFYEYRYDIKMDRRKCRKGEKR